MILCVGVDYHTMKVEDREVFSISPEILPEIYREVKGHFTDTVFLSTCNRMEVYFSGTVASQAVMIDWLIAKFLPVDTPSEKKEYFKAKFEHHRGGGAIRHLFEVAAGLHSMVVGENQVLHQVKRAYQDACNQQVLDAEFHRLFQSALGLGKKVRTQTDIGKGGMSLGSVSVDIIKKFYEKKSHFTVALIGAGEIAEEVLRSLLYHGRVRVLLCNRDPQRAQKLLERYQRFFSAAYIPFADRYRIAAEANVIVVSTNAQGYVLTKPELERALDGHCRFSFYIDLSVPRNIDPAVSQLQDVVLYSLDDFEKIISENYSQRSSQITACNNLIEEQLQSFEDWVKNRRWFSIKEEWERLLKDVNQDRQEKLLEPISVKKLEIFFEKNYAKFLNWEDEEILTKSFLTRTLKEAGLLEMGME